MLYPECVQEKYIVNFYLSWLLEKCLDALLRKNLSWLTRHPERRQNRVRLFLYFACRCAVARQTPVLVSHINARNPFCKLVVTSFITNNDVTPSPGIELTTFQFRATAALAPGHLQPYGFPALPENLTVFYFKINSLHGSFEILFNLENDLNWLFKDTLKGQIFYWYLQSVIFDGNKMFLIEEKRILQTMVFVFTAVSSSVQPFNQVIV